MAGSRSSEKYSCDACRSSKVACSRESLHCSRCVEKELQCVYSRSGIITRKRTSRKRTSERESVNTATPSTLGSDAEALGDSMRGVESHLEDDVTMTQQHSHIMTDHVPMDALSSLSNTCSRFTLGERRNVFIMRAKGFQDMSKHSRVLVQALDSAGATSSWLNNAPLNVKTHFQSGNPQKVHDSAWLVMYYASLVSNASITQPLREKMQDNLWHALSDARVLLEPSELNIRAILMVLSDAVAMMTPTMCWMLSSTACRMFSSLGSNWGRPSAPVGSEQKRRTLFWHLNLMDKAFAIIFRKSPTFNRKMVRKFGPSTVQDFLPATGGGRGGPSDPVGLFTAHYVYQKVQLSYLMHDIWTYLYDEDSPDYSRVESILESLHAWHDEARKVLQAASLTEQLFSTNDHIESMKAGLRAMRFHYTYLVIILTKSSAEHQELCVEFSESMLNELKELPCLPNQPYQPFIWQLLCCPFTPFLVLFRTIMFDADDEKEGQLSAMRQLPKYLEEAKAITPLANKLQEVANVILRHASTSLAEKETYIPQSVPGSQPTPQHHLSMDTSLPMGADDSSDFSEAMKTMNTSTETMIIDDDDLFVWLDWEEEFDFSAM
ncbi:hypothetical protein CC79DRAFT_1395599 [Sarocladium strictum]